MMRRIKGRTVLGAIVLLCIASSLSLALLTGFTPNTYAEIDINDAGALCELVCRNIYTDEMSWAEWARCVLTVMGEQ